MIVYISESKNKKVKTKAVHCPKCKKRICDVSVASDAKIMWEENHSINGIYLKCHKCPFEYKVQIKYHKQ